MLLLLLLFYFATYAAAVWKRETPAGRSGCWAYRLVTHAQLRTRSKLECDIVYKLQTVDLKLQLNEMMAVVPGLCVCVWKKEYTQVHTGVGEIVSAVPTIDSKRNAHI